PLLSEAIRSSGRRACTPIRCPCERDEAAEAPEERSGAEAHSATGRACALRSGPRIRTPSPEGYESHEPRPAGGLRLGVLPATPAFYRGGRSAYPHRARRRRAISGCRDTAVRTTPWRDRPLLRRDSRRIGSARTPALRAHRQPVDRPRRLNSSTSDSSLKSFCSATMRTPSVW